MAVLQADGAQQHWVASSLLGVGTCRWKWACRAALSLSSTLQRPEEPSRMLSWLGVSCCWALWVLAGVAGSPGEYALPAWAQGEATLWPMQVADACERTAKSAWHLNSSVP